MATPALSEIESELARLSPEAQLSLLERLVHRDRVALTRRPDNWEADLSAGVGGAQYLADLRGASRSHFIATTGTPRLDEAGAGEPD